MDQWIIGIIEKTGYLGIAVLAVLENVFPPIPSELVMPFAGFVAARGQLDLGLVVVAGTVGSVIGALPWYAAGRWLGRERLTALAHRHGRWLTLAPGDVDRAQRTFARHSANAVLFGRLVPAIRSLISVPAGIARMGLVRFLAYSTVGSAIWIGALAILGHALGAEYARVSQWMGPVSNVLVAAIVLWYVIRVVRWEPFPGGEGPGRSSP